MINVENDYEPIIYEQPIYYHIYQNPDQFLLNYYTRPIPVNKTKKNRKISRRNNRRKKPQNAQAQTTFIKTNLKNRSYEKKKSGQSHFF